MSLVSRYPARPNMTLEDLKERLSKSQGLELVEMRKNRPHFGVPQPRKIERVVFEKDHYEINRAYR